MAGNDGAPITRGELLEILTQLEDRLMNRIEGRIDAAETRILDALHDHVAAAELRIQRVESSDAVLVERLAILERRLLRVERRLDLGPEQ